MFQKDQNTRQRFVEAVQFVAGILAERYLETPAPIAALAAQLTGGGSFLNSPTDEPEPVLTRQEAAKTLKLSVNTIRRMEADGTLHPIPACRPRIRYRRDEIQRLIDKRR